MRRLPSPSSLLSITWLILLSLAFPLAGCDSADDDDGGDAGVEAPRLLDEVAASAAAGETVRFRVEVGGDVHVAVTRGGGRVAVVEQADGVATVEWVLGVAPVENGVRVSAGGSADGSTEGSDDIELRVRATLAMPYRAEPFGDVHAFLDAEGQTESTEDLTFTSAGLLMGAPGGLLHVTPDGMTSRFLMSDDLSRVWGFAAGPGGVLWAVDAGNGRMVRILADGSVEQALTTDGMQALAGANYVALDGEGRVYLSDPCLGEIIRLDPATDEIAVHRFDLLTEGGPNGMALSPDGMSMYVATENTGLLCRHGDVPLQDPIAGVYVFDIDDFGSHTPVVEGIGLFGDGLAFDVEGNLYVVVDREENFMLTQSAVVVIPAGETTPIDFLVAGGRQVFANVAFGTGAYGTGTLYIALLAVPGFGDPDSRGLERFEVGIAGLPLGQ